MTARKLIAICLIGVMAMGLLAGCGGKQSQSASASSIQSDKSETENTDTAENTETVSNLAESSDVADASDTMKNEGKVLVVYYSATGTTKGVAQNLAKVTDGDLFEIEPVEPYTDDDLDWNSSDSRVSKEHDDESLRDVELVSTSVENWEAYDTVYIGYPIWWGIAAWPVNDFVKANDFTGKTVIPFCTSASSEIGDSGNLLEEMTGTGNWKEGNRIRGDASEDDISTWINELGL